MPDVSDPIRATWKGALNADGSPVEFIEGIPARDITESEYQALTNEQRAAVRASDLWDQKTDAEMQPALKRAEKAAERATAQAEKEAARADASKGGTE